MYYLLYGNPKRKSRKTGLKTRRFYKTHKGASSRTAGRAFVKNAWTLLLLGEQGENAAEAGADRRDPAQE